MVVRTRPVSWCRHEVNVPGVGVANYETETAFQIYCADWLRKQYALTKNDGYTHWHHSANERDGLLAGLTAKMMGQSKGMPDLIQCGLMVAIELKLPGRQATKEQVEWLKYFSEIGWFTEVVYSFERFKEIVQGRVGSREAKSRIES